MSELQLVTLEDRRAVYALLDRMLDWLPPARLSTVRDSGSKPGVGEWRRCGRCAGSGRVTGEGLGARACRQAHARWPFGHGCRPCANCQAGWVRVATRRGDDPAGSSRMLEPGKHELHTDAQLRAEGRRWVDGQLLKLEALARQRGDARDPRTGLRLPPEAPDDELSAALRSKEALYGSGSFARLETALELLGIQFPYRLEAIRLFVIDHQADANPTTRAHLHETVDWLAARMPRPILLPADAAAEVEAWKRSLENGRTADHRRQREQRDVEILDLVETHGWSLRRIGRVYGLSPEGVRRALARVTERVLVASGPAA